MCEGERGKDIVRESAVSIYYFIIICSYIFLLVHRNNNTQFRLWTVSDYILKIPYLLSHFLFFYIVIISLSSHSNHPFSLTHINCFIYVGKKCESFEVLLHNTKGKKRREKRFKCLLRSERERDLRIKVKVPFSLIIYIDDQTFTSFLPCKCLLIVSQFVSLALKEESRRVNLSSFSYCDFF